MRFSKILCATDFSAGAEGALRTAIQVAARDDAELVISYCVYVPAIAYGADNPAALDIERLGDEAEDQLDKLVATAKQAGVARAGCKLLVGVPWSELVDLASEEAFDLCVLGTHGRTGVERVLLGSVAEKLVRHSPCSVLAVHPADAVKAPEHILVPTDFSESAEHAAEIATQHVQPGGRITLLHVVELPVALAGSLPVGGVQRELEQCAAKALERARIALEANVETVTRVGTAGAEVLHVLEHDPTIDLVVTGSHSRTGIKRILLGSVAEKIVRHARCPVLVARVHA